MNNYYRRERHRKRTSKSCFFNIIIILLLILAIGVFIYSSINHKQIGGSLLKTGTPSIPLNIDISNQIQGYNEINNLLINTLK